MGSIPPAKPNNLKPFLITITQNKCYEAELRGFIECLYVCVSMYGALLLEIQIAINSIKCVYFAGYHQDKGCFNFCSCGIRAESVIHVFLHNDVHPVVVESADKVLEKTDTPRQ